MRKMGLVTGLLAGLAVVLAAVGALCGAAVSLARMEKTYSEDSRAAVMDAMGLTSQQEVTAYIGMDEAQQAELAAALAAQMAGEPERAVTAERLSEAERQHLRDVQWLVALGDSVSKGCVSLAAALAVVVAWTGARLSRRRRTTALGALCGAAAVLLLAGAAALAVLAGGFEAAFVRLHGLAFDNTLWLMNPQTDMLIRMMPQLLFERLAASLPGRAGAALFCILAMLALVTELVGGMIGRHLSEEKQA